MTETFNFSLADLMQVLLTFALVFGAFGLVKERISVIETRLGEFVKDRDTRRGEVDDKIKDIWSEFERHGDNNEKRISAFERRIEQKIDSVGTKVDKIYEIIINKLNNHEK